MTKQCLVKTEGSLGNILCFIFRVRERILGSVKAERKNRNFILLWRLFSFWEKMFNFGKF